MPTYADFFVTIDGVAGNYTVEVRGPSGTLVGPVPFLYNETDALRQQLTRLKAGSPPAPQAMVEMGSVLYEALFPRRIYGLWRTWHSGQTKLRLKLNVRPPELTSLPWELLYNPDKQSFLAARLSFPIVRYIESDMPVGSALTEGPLRVLHVQANPFDTAPLDLKQSENAISKALGKKGEITIIRETSPARLREVLRERPGFDILHYDGHGMFVAERGEGYLALHNKKGKTHPLSGQQLANYLDGSGIRLVFLAACQTGIDSTEKRFSGIAQRLMRISNLPAAVAMQFAIPDGSAIEFIYEFYKALADHYPIDAAMIEGRKALLSHSGQAKADWATPVLFMRSDDGYILHAKREQKEKNDKTIQTLTEGLAKLPTNYGWRIENFMHEYLGTSKRQVPFGGRERELAALDAWLNDPDAPSYALLAAEAGCGKSALLVHWVQSLVASDKATVIFLPVSIRFETNRATVAFTALAARLGEVYGEPIEWKNLSAHQWQAVCESYLRRSPPDGKPLVVILDGLDEAADFTIGASFFPLRPPAGVRAVVSARYLAGDVDESGWRRRLGWESDAVAISLPLPPLTQAGLRDVLHQMGNPLDQLSSKVDVVDRLYHLSEGDPLLVRLYVEALLPVGEHAALMTPEQLENIQPGLSGYFKRWWEEQRKLWGKQNPMREKSVQVVLNLLACAQGPLDQDTLLDLSPPDADLDSWTLEDTLEPLARFIVGNGQEQGYVFSHPRLGYYFWERLSKRTQREWEERFLNFGHQTLEALNNGTLHPHNAPSYAIQYYGTHLERANASSAAYYRLVSEGWMRAWEALEGTYAGFLNDVGQAWQRAEEERNIAMIVKCSLCQASVAALSANIPPKLLAQAVKHGLLTPVQGLVIVRQMPDEKQKVEALLALAPSLPSDLFREALQVARQIQSDFWRAKALSGLATHLPAELLAEALSVTRQIQDEWFRADAFSGLAPHLPAELLGEVLSAARQIQDDFSRAKALIELVAYRSELFAEALEVARQIQDDFSRAQALSGLAAHHSELLAEALEAARQIRSDRSRAQALRALAAYLPAELLAEALCTTRQIQSDQYRAWALSELAAHLPAELFAEALEVARLIQDESYRANALSELAVHLPAELFAEALEVARLIQDESARADALSGLAARLPTELFAKALEVARQIQSESSRGYSLSALVAHHPELFAEALEVARLIQSDEYRAQALSGLAAYHPELFAEALAAARQIQDPQPRARALIKLAAHHSELGAEALEVTRKIQDPEPRAYALIELAAHHSELFAEALEAARQIQDNGYRVQALSRLTAHLSPPLLGEALEVARLIQDDFDRAKALSGLAAHLPLERLGEVLEVVRLIQSEWHRANALKGLAAYLSAELFAKALEVARQIQSERYRANALRGLAAHLPAELFAKALEVARLIQDESSRAYALSGLAARLPAELFAEALEIARQIQDKSSRCHALSGLVAHHSELFAEALEVARQIQDKSSRAYALRGLVAHHSELLGEALEVTRLIQSERYRAYALSELATHLPAELLGEALEVARLIQSESYRAYALSELATHLPAELLGEALEVARLIQSDEYCAHTLRKLAARLPAELLGEALEVARLIQSESYRAYALSGLTAHLPAELLAQALEAARLIQSDQDRGQALNGLAAHYPELLAEALSAARQIQSDQDRAYALSGLAAHLPSELLGEALEAARQIQDDKYRAEALSALAAHLVKLLPEKFNSVQIEHKGSRTKTDPSAVYIAWQESIWEFSARPRPKFLQDLHILMPFTLALAGEEVDKVAEGICRAIQEVCAWWP